MLIILDGAMGTELTRRGINTTLPLWSARALMDAPEVVAQIHRDYLVAGAQVLTANTFRTNVRTMQRAGMADGGRELTHKAVQLARKVMGEWGLRPELVEGLEIAADSPIPNPQSLLVAGSMAPVEDCYSPELVPSDDDLRAEHGALARNLADAGCDLILVETMNTIREAVIAAQSAARTGLPLWVSFTLNERNDLLSGETLADAVQAVLPYQPRAMLVNCIPVAQVAGALAKLRDATDLRIGAYGNVGHVDDAVGWTLTHAVSPAAYAEAAREWQALGATIIGGCCGTMPAHIAALAPLKSSAI
jgi:S-methylmethionine-dependent homocysteine/selenocysteine methylase